MKIGINNIFTSFWFLAILICSGTLTFFSLNENVFTSDLLIAGKIVIGFLMLIFIGILLFLLYKFRILIVDKNSIISLHPFLLKKRKIDLTQIKKQKLENFFAFNGIVFRKVTLKDHNTKIEITDLEFENFEKLICDLKIDRVKKKEIDFEQAKSNLSNTNFNVYILSGFLIFLVFNTIWNSGFHLLIVAFFVCAIVLLYASISRKMKYEQTLDNQ